MGAIACEFLMARQTQELLPFPDSLSLVRGVLLANLLCTPSL